MSTSIVSPSGDLKSSGWIVTNTKGETLTITIEEVYLDVEREMGAEPGLQKDGVEAHLQELLAANPGMLAEGLMLIRREYPTAIGPANGMPETDSAGAVPSAPVLTA